MGQKVNLNAYFERIGFSGSIAPTLATLEMIHALHPATIPVSNLSSLLGQPSALDIAGVGKKLLSEKRGGNGYEHNLLLAAVLRELDYPVRTLAARMVRSEPDSVDETPQHMLLAIDIGGTSYIADAGNVGLTLTAPLKLKADLEQTTPHETFRLVGGQPEWRLEARIGEDWRGLYMFELADRNEADFGAADSDLSGPASPSRKQLRAALSPSGKRIVLLNNRLTTRIQGEPSQVQALSSVADVRAVLSETFGIALPPADLLDRELAAILADAGVTEN